MDFKLSPTSLHYENLPMQYTKTFLALKFENFQLKIFDIFSYFCSNEYPQSMFWSKNKKRVYHCKPQFYYIKVGYKGVYITRTCFPDVLLKAHQENMPAQYIPH